jgi:hypothetical protein
MAQFNGHYQVLRCHPAFGPSAQMDLPREIESAAYFIKYLRTMDLVGSFQQKFMLAPGSRFISLHDISMLVLRPP